MKQSFLIILFTLFVNSKSEATIRTVCNMPYSPGQFTTFNAALAAAANFDTIYVHGSSFNYGNATINKTGIVVIGAGHNPNKQAPLPTSFTGITIIPGFTKVQLIGLAIESLNIGNLCHNTVVKRCRFVQFVTPPPSYISLNTGGGSVQSLLIEGCLFSFSNFISIDINLNNNIVDSTIIRNNIFEGSLISNAVPTNPNTFFITNNIFNGNFSNAFTNINQAKINNNIFYGMSPQGANTINCSMNNNISFATSNNSFPSPGSNNLVNINPLFVFAPAPGLPMTYANDFHFFAGSPAINSGNDGTDRGVFGGFGFKFNMTGEPAMAEVTAFAITSPNVIAPGGTLNITVTSKRIK